MVVEVIGNDLSPLLETYSTERGESCQLRARLALVNFAVVRVATGQPPVGLLRDVVAQDVEDESLLDCLMHRVDMKWLKVAGDRMRCPE